MVESLINAVVANQGSYAKGIIERIDAVNVMEPLWYALWIDLGGEVEPAPVEGCDAMKTVLEEFSPKRS
ncbi:MAG: hypothetical protein OXC63_12370 [Aestuariivita sp.]|nr:hypothetical protein [Aestuariivita sp.]